MAGLVELDRLHTDTHAGTQSLPTAGSAPDDDASTATATATATRAAVGVVIHSGEQRLALLVDRIVGKQEVVVKELDDATGRGDLFAGATIRDDGGISLIFEPDAIFRQSSR